MSEMKQKVSKLAKLTRGDVRRILRMWEDGSQSGRILEEFPQISQSTLSAILSRKVYRAITDEFMASIGISTLRRSNQQEAVAAAYARSSGTAADFDPRDDYRKL